MTLLVPWLLASVAAVSPLSSSSLVAGAGCDGRSDKKELQAAAPCIAPTNIMIYSYKCPLPGAL